MCVQRLEFDVGSLQVQYTVGVALYADCKVWLSHMWKNKLVSKTLKLEHYSNNGGT